MMGMQESWARLYAPKTPREAHRLWMVVTFVNRAGPQRLLGPLESLWMEGRTLRSDRFGASLAGTYYRVETDAPVVVHFAGRELSRSRTFGPYTHFSVVDRLVYADGKALALYSAKLDQWLCYDAGQHFPAMVVSAAGAAA